eukprot:scaffold19802_cov112-Isochrysis_galbana.AAC.5
MQTTCAGQKRTYTLHAVTVGRLATTADRAPKRGDRAIRAPRTVTDDYQPDSRAERRTGTAAHRPVMNCTVP